MCTAAIYKTKDCYFGRTLDHDISYHEEIVITPRFYEFHFRNKVSLKNHYAIIGMAIVKDNYPLYYDAINEKGLGIAGLNFVGNAFYNSVYQNKDNVASFELIPWILSQCANVDEAYKLLMRINITDDRFQDNMMPAELHWIICDSERSITLESTKEGIKIYDNPVGILTNNPSFDKQLFSLNNYMHLSPYCVNNSFAEELDLRSYSHGMGAIGLPGDCSSQSRFIRAAFVKMNSISGTDELESVNQMFHILNSVDQQRGCNRVDDNHFLTTIYTSCCNLNQGIYYYTTYDNHQISAICMHNVNLDSDTLIVYPLNKTEIINYQN